MIMYEENALVHTCSPLAHVKQILPKISSLEMGMRI